MTGPRAGTYDILVVGAGPAGSAVAGLLAAAGRRVLVLEREQFPRFHIGESLLPAGLRVLDRLGVPADAGTFVQKGGARFVCEASGRAQRFDFADAGEGVPRQAWHVDRASFDLALRDRAVALGADVRHGVTVTDLDADAERAWVESSAGRFEGRYVVDASGQSRLRSRRARTAQPYRSFGSTAAFTHFEGLTTGGREALGPENDIHVMIREDGWGWVIPLPGGRLSVGLVSSGRATVEALERGLLAGPFLSQVTAGARRLESHVVADFSYRDTEPVGPRRAAIGDAACFLDPVFSSGVTLALRSAESVADAVAPALAAGREAEPDLLTAHVSSMDRAYRTFEALIHRFYNTRLAETLFLTDSGDRDLRVGVMRVLAGDVWRADNPFQEMLLRASRTTARDPEPEAAARKAPGVS